MNVEKKLATVSRAAIAAGSLCALVAAGCGGSSAPTVDRATVRTRVETSLEEGFSSHEMAFGTGDSDPSTRFGEPVYDPYLELWSQFTEDGADYFTDEACTDPAGTLRITFDGDPESGSFSIVSTQTVDKGPRAGTRFESEVGFGENGLTVTGSGTAPETGPFTLSGTWQLDGSGNLVLKSQKPGEEQRTYRIVTRADGTSQVTFDNAQWHKYTLDFNADGSGSGTVTGSSDLLPASVVWNSDGDGTVTYKDGSTRTFDNFRFDG